MLYVGFSPSRYVNPASRIDFTDATLASSLVPVQCASLAPPAVRQMQMQKHPWREAKVRADVHVCAPKRQENEDMTRGRDGTKVRAVEMKGEPSAQGQPMKPTSL